MHFSSFSIPALVVPSLSHLTPSKSPPLLPVSSLFFSPDPLLLSFPSFSSFAPLSPLSLLITFPSPDHLFLSPRLLSPDPLNLSCLFLFSCLPPTFLIHLSPSSLPHFPFPSLPLPAPDHQCVNHRCTLLQLMRCVRSFHGRCMQSDWMIAGCARWHNVSHLRALGCGTCDVNRIDRAVVQSKLRRAECFFMQNVESLKHHLPASAHAPGIVHGLGNSEVC